MANDLSSSAAVSAERQAFNHYLRTGQRLSPAIFEEPIERKFNPYHDPRNGQFNFAPGGPRSSISARRGSSKVPPSGRVPALAKPKKIQTNAPASQPPAVVSDALFRPGGAAPSLQPAQFRPNPRVRIGDNGGPPLNDPLTLTRVFPGINSSPGGTILAMANNIFDFTGPATEATVALTEAQASRIIAQIRVLEPNYRLDSLGFPTTIEGQENFIRQLRLERAAAFYRTKNELRPLQVETLRRMQEQADEAYDTGMELYNKGKLNVRLSREEAIGNYVDRSVRSDLRRLYGRLGIETGKGEVTRINGREYDTSGSDLTYRLPDARVGNIAFDVTLTPKTLATAQVRGFFASDFKPSSVIIVRPKQLGPGNSYAIVKPGK